MPIELEAGWGAQNWFGHTGEQKHLLHLLALYSPYTDVGCKFSANV
jgi:hypothetical protein